MRITAEMTGRKKILIIKLGAFGDIVIAEGAIHDIRNNFMDDQITVLTSPPYKKIFERCQWVDAVMEDPREPRWRLDLMYRLNRRVCFDSFDVIFDLQRSNRGAFYHRWFVKKAAWSGMAPGCSLPYSIPPSKEISVLEEFAIQLESAGLSVKHTLSPDPAWFADDVSEILAEADIKDPYVVLLAGASAGHTEKCWPYYDRLASMLIDKGICVLTVPGPEDIELCRTIPGIMLTGPHKYLDFFQLAGVLKGAGFVVGNDSGPSHLASHLGVPGLALFGGHVSAYRTGIEHDSFRCIEVKRLADLPADQVCEKVLHYLDHTTA